MAAASASPGTSLSSPATTPAAHRPRTPSTSAGYHPSMAGGARGAQGALGSPAAAARGGVIPSGLPAAAEEAEHALGLMAPEPEPEPNPKQV